MLAPYEIALRDALANRLAIVADHALRDSDPGGHLEKLKSAAAELDNVIAHLPPTCDPQLRHFLRQQSYTKALAFLTVA